MSTATKPAPDEVLSKKSSSVTAGGLAVKLTLVGMIDALLVWALIQCVSDGWRLGIGFFILALIAVNLVYFTRGLPMKYLLPGLMFLLVYQLFTMVLTGYSSFTNYGTGHLGDQGDAISALLAREEQPVPDSAAYPVVPIEKGGTVSMLVTFPEGTDQAGQTYIGTPESLEPVPPDQLEVSADKVTGVQGYQSLNLGTLSSNPDFTAQWGELRVPLNEATGTFLKASSIFEAKEYKSGFVYDEATDTMTDTNTGVVYAANGTTGNFTAPDGTTLDPGWIVGVGLKNYSSLLTDPTIRNNFLPIMAWTFAFAFLTVFSTFALGLLLAIVMQDRRMKGQKYYMLVRDDQPAPSRPLRQYRQPRTARIVVADIECATRTVRSRRSPIRMAPVPATRTRPVPTSTDTPRHTTTRPYVAWLTRPATSGGSMSRPRTAGRAARLPTGPTSRAWPTTSLRSWAPRAWGSTRPHINGRRSWVAPVRSSPPRSLPRQAFSTACRAGSRERPVLAGAQANCSTEPLTGGRVTVTQYLLNGLDHNHACA